MDEKNMQINSKSERERVNSAPLSFVIFKTVAVFFCLGFFVLLFPQKSFASVFPDSWSRRVAITIDYTKVSSSTVNIPILITEVNLPSEIFDADGLYSADNGGGDIRFTADINGSTKLPIEVVSFVTNNNPALGTAEIWVNIPSLSASVNTTIYIWYHNPGDIQPARTDNPDVDGFQGSNYVWDNNYVVVHHLNTDPSGAAPQEVDSTVNANNGTKSGTWLSDQLVIGKIGNGLNFITDSSNIFDLGVGSNLNTGQDYTIELWAKPSSTSNSIVLSKSAADSLGYSLWINTNKYVMYTALSTTNYATSGYRESITSTTSANTSAFQKITITANTSSNIEKTRAPYPISHMSGITYGGKLYSISGHNGSAATANITDKVQIYDSVANTWSQGTVIPTKRWGAGVAEVNGIIYVMGGSPNGAVDASNKNEAYDVSGNSWTDKTVVPAALAYQGLSLTAYNGNIYAFYGVNVQMYNPVDNSWTALTSSGVDVGSWQDVYTVGNYIYTIGGSSSKTLIRRFDPNTNSWDDSYGTVPTGAGGWAHTRNTVYNSIIYYGVGKDPWGAQSKRIWKYNPAVKPGVWTELTPDSMEGNALASGFIGNKLYISGIRYLGTALSLQDFHSCFNADTEQWETSAGAFKIWYNGATEATYNIADTIATNTKHFYLSSQDSAGSLYFPGILDEVKVSNVDRSSWVLTQYNNESSPSTFSIAGTPNTAPSMVYSSISSLNNGDVTIPYTLTDADSDTITLTVQYSTDNSTWSTATKGTGGSNITGLTPGPSGTSYSFIWDTATDLPTTEDTTVYIKITPSDGGGGLTAYTTSSFGVDNVLPTLSQTTAVTNPTDDTTPNYVFNSNEAGTITYGGSCSSATTSAVSGDNTITFNTLADATYNNCTIVVTDVTGNASSALSVSSFTVATIPRIYGASGTHLLIGAITPTPTETVTPAGVQILITPEQQRLELIAQIKQQLIELLTQLIQMLTLQVKQMRG